MHHGTNFIFSNRDLRSPQASTPPPVAYPKMHCSGLLFSSREYFPPPTPPSYHRDFLPRPVPGVLIFRATRWKYKKRHLYESVFCILFAVTLLPIPFHRRTSLSCFSSSTSGSWRTFHLTPSRNRNEGRK